MNVLDGQRMAGQLEAQGLRRAGDREDPSVVLLNTCSVREKAEAKVFSALGVLARRKQDDPGSRHRRHRVRRAGLRRRDPGARAMGRFRRRDRAGGARRGARGRGARRAQTGRGSSTSRRRLPSTSSARSRRDSAFQAYVTVIEGCDQFCTFCIVPFTRGRERSRRSSEILAELSHLACLGYTEVTLLGQTVNAYRDPEAGFGLGELLRRAARVDGTSARPLPHVASRLRRRRPRRGPAPRATRSRRIFTCRPSPGPTAS